MFKNGSVQPWSQARASNIITRRAIDVSSGPRRSSLVSATVGLGRFLKENASASLSATVNETKLSYASVLIARLNGKRCEAASERIRLN
jgi:hypothetical protein